MNVMKAIMKENRTGEKLLGKHSGKLLTKLYRPNIPPASQAARWSTKPRDNVSTLADGNRPACGCRMKILLV